VDNARSGGHQRQQPCLQNLLGPVKFLAVKDGVLECHWKLADGKAKTAQTVIPRCKAKELLAVMHGGFYAGTSESTRHSIKSDSDNIFCT
jgi:hypothetical protein